MVGASVVLDSGAPSGVVSSPTAASFGNAGSMEQREFERALTSPHFVTANEAMKGAEGVAIIDAAISGSVLLMLRFIFSAPH